MKMQEKIEDVWNDGAQKYNDNLIKDQLTGLQKERWMHLIKENLPRKGKLKILDVGTGPGFFAIILSLAGHEVVGIDCTSAMLEQAKMNAQKEGVTPEFLLADSHDLKFPAETFDVVINRNVVWTLREPKKAYAEWKRVLKKEGRLIVFDADWFRRKYDAAFAKQEQQALEEYRKKFPNRFKSINTGKLEHIIDELAHNNPRPEWDQKILEELDYRNIHIDDTISERIYIEQELLICRLNKNFMICADK